MLLDELQTKIGDKKQHHSAKALKVASDLLLSLQHHKNLYKKDLTAGVIKTTADFKLLEAYTTEIGLAKKELKNDLQWTSILANLLRAFLNLFIRLGSNNPNHLFAYTKPKSVEALEEFEPKIRLTL